MVDDADVLACQLDRGATGGHFDGALVLNGGPGFAVNRVGAKSTVAGHLAPSAHRCVGGNVDVAVNGYAVFNDDLVIPGAVDDARVVRVTHQHAGTRRVFRAVRPRGQGHGGQHRQGQRDVRTGPNQ